VLSHLGQTFSGVVRDALTADPIAGAKLLVRQPSSRRRQEEVRRRVNEATTDATGTFYSIVNVNGRPSRCLDDHGRRGNATQVHNNFSLVERPSRARSSRIAKPPARMTSKQQDFEMQPGKVIAGRVLGPDTRGPAGHRTRGAQSSRHDRLGPARHLRQERRVPDRGSGRRSLHGCASSRRATRRRPSNASSRPRPTSPSSCSSRRASRARSLTPDGRPLDSFTVKVRTANDVSNAFGQVLARRRQGLEGRLLLGRGNTRGNPTASEGTPRAMLDLSASPQTPCKASLTSASDVRMSTGGTLGGIVTDASGGAAHVASRGTMDNNWNRGHSSSCSPLRASALTEEQDSHGRRGPHQPNSSRPRVPVPKQGQGLLPHLRQRL
jgi:hypothetical protein